MADEATVFKEGVEKAIVLQYTVADANALDKGDLLIRSGDRTGVAHAGEVTARPFGYTTHSKEASDGQTAMGCLVFGVVEAVADGVWTTGDTLVLGSSANRLRRMNTSAFGLSYQEVQAIVGTALEDATNGQKKRVFVHIV